jgi:hypothetical protein
MSTVEEIVQAVKDLPPEEWDEMKRRLVLFWLQSERPDLAMSMENKRIRAYASSTPRKRSEARKPAIQVKGKPISETIVEDRR